MPPQANLYEGVVDDETALEVSSERTNPSIRKIPARFLLVEDPKKAPMNPEEVYLMKLGQRMMAQSIIEAQNSPKTPPEMYAVPPRVSAPIGRNKNLANGFLQRLSKSKLRLPRIPRKI